MAEGQPILAPGAQEATDTITRVLIKTIVAKVHHPSRHKRKLLDCALKTYTQNQATGTRLAGSIVPFFNNVRKSCFFEEELDLRFWAGRVPVFW